MPKDVSVPSISSDPSVASPCSSSVKASKKRKFENLLQSVCEKKDYEVAKCPICMETPHNAVLLLCSNHEKGCSTYMCNTSNSHSNCLHQFLKSSSSKTTLSCPLCRGEINEQFVIETVSKFTNSVPRSCSVGNCEFTGTYAELEKHASQDHLSAMPSQVDPVWQHGLFTLEIRSQDRNLMVLPSDSEDVLPQTAGHDDVEEVSIANGSIVRRPPHYRRTMRMSVGGSFPRRQLARRTARN